MNGALTNGDASHHGSHRAAAGSGSRNFYARHDGLSFAILGIRWVSSGGGVVGRLRGKGRRERMRRSAAELTGFMKLAAAGDDGTKREEESQGRASLHVWTASGALRPAARPESSRDGRLPSCKIQTKESTRGQGSRGEVQWHEGSDWLTKPRTFPCCG